MVRLSRLACSETNYLHPECSIILCYVLIFTAVLFQCCPQETR